jgi:hypothetical protein
VSGMLAEVGFTIALAGLCGAIMVIVLVVGG